MNLNYEDIIKFEDLNGFEPSKVVAILGVIFETGRERQSDKGIEVGLAFAEKQNLDKFSDHDKMIFHYNLANGWAYRLTLAKEDGLHDLDNKELEKQIINLRLALQFSKTVNDDFNKCQIFTNLGNLFSHLGRFSEAQEYWRKAIKINSAFPMAIGNIGVGLAYYGKVIYDEGHQAFFFKLAYKYLNQALDSDIHPEEKDAFKSVIEALEFRFTKKSLKEMPNLAGFEIGDTPLEKSYRRWCLNNHLFLNPLNDILIENIASHDCLYLPSIVTEFDKAPVSQTIFNQIKQEFVSARYLLFEGINNKGVHFSDKDNLQMDTLDYAVYSLSCEKVKIAFRFCYSILDKVAYLLNDYLKLGIKPNAVSFRKIWFEYDKKGKLVGLNSKIANSQNWAFRGLYWLSKDLYESDLSYLTSIEPESKELALIRNFIEHKSFKLVDLGENGLKDNDLTLVIQRDDFEQKTMKLIKLVRASMIYLSLGINIEEGKKEKKWPVLPIEFIELKDEYKT